jgi:hypothetical protein
MNKSIAHRDWSSLAHGGHGVQFYATDQHLIDMLARYMGAAIIMGDVGVMIATEVHRRAVERQLKWRGLDVNVPAKQGRYFTADAMELLPKLLRNGSPDRLRFNSAIGSLLARAAEASSAGEPHRVLVFGEFVSLVWAQGRPNAAVSLEEMWNELAAAHEFTLCCGYPMHGFTAVHAAPFIRICAQHSHVFPAAGPLTLPVV